MYWNTSFTYTCTFKMSIVSVQGLLAYSANCTFWDYWNLWQVPVVTSIYMSLQLIKTWVNKSIVRYILVRKRVLMSLSSPLCFFIYFVHKKRNIKKIVLVLYLWWVLTLWTVLILWRVLSLDERSKTKQTTTSFGPGSSPYAVEYSLTVTISDGPTISFVD